MPPTQHSRLFTAIIADDEPLLVESLQRELKKSWPELAVVATAHNGADASRLVFEHTPDVVFLDIQMPGATGLDVAQRIAEEWPEGANCKATPLIVFATAFDHYAIEAFDSAAVDYLIKPVKQQRLALTVQRLQGRLGEENKPATDALALQLQQLLAMENQRSMSVNTAPRLSVIRASTGDQIRVIPIEDVILFESADKYVSVYTIEGESLIREPLKKLLPQLDETGKVTLNLKGIDKQTVVSRVFRHLFQPM